MKASERVHRSYVAERRARVLARHLAELVPRDIRLLDVGCGDGRIAQILAVLRPDLHVEGIDVRRRADAAIPVTTFDGRTIPFPDDGFDALLFVDVLHHSDDPAALLREARRVAARWLVVKDHVLTGWLAGPTLRFMDRVGNERHDVPLPYHYWTHEAWRRNWEQLDVEVECQRDRLGLYPWPASLLFDRALHFAARLALRDASPAAPMEPASASPRETS